MDVRRLIVPCYSNAPDRDLDHVTFEVTTFFLGMLAQRFEAFMHTQMLDGHTAETIFRMPGFTLETAAYSDDEETLWAPDGADEINHHLGIMDGDEPPLKYTKLEQEIFLHVHSGGFYFSWAGRQEKHGPSEDYESDTFSLSDLQGEQEGQARAEARAA